MFRIIDCSPDCCTLTSEGEEVHVSCRGCGLESVPEDLPRNTSFLDLTNNRIKSLNEKSFMHLQHLETLLLVSNGLSYISSGAFYGLHNLRYLDLKDNVLGASLGGSVFKSLTNLRFLNIQRNMYHIDLAYPEEALSALWKLETLYLDIFEGFRFGNGYLNLTNLTKLYLLSSTEESVSVRNASFIGLARSGVAHLNFDFTLRAIEKDALLPFRKLKTFSLDSRRDLDIVTVLPLLYGLRNRTMESITLKNNFIEFTENKLDKSDIDYLKWICVKRVYLMKNAIADISTNAIASWSRNTCLQILDVSYNVFRSPKYFYAIALFPSLTHFYATYMIPMQGPGRRELKEERRVYLPKNLIYLNITHGPFGGTLQNITIVNGNKLEIMDISYPRQSAYCRSGRLTGLPGLKEFYISGRDCSQPNPKMFSDMRNLSLIEAKHCNLGMRLSTNETSLFQGLYNLSYIDLSANEIQRLQMVLFKDQSQSLRNLILSENRMLHLPASIENTLNSLELLDISHNGIVTLEATDCSVLDTMKAKTDRFIVKLTGNPFVCNCDNLDFIRWMDRTDVVYDKNNIQCVTADGSRVTFGTLLEDLHSFQASCVSRFWLIVSVTLLILITVFGTVSVILWRYSVKLRVWCRRPKEHGFTYDVFLSYSHKDSGWIAKTLVPMLEQEGIRYCCYDKDFDPGKDIADNIMDAIDCSRKVLFVVTYNFIHSEWATYEMGLTSMYAFRDGREDMNILVFLEDIKRSEMPKVMRRIWDTVVCLEWPNERNTHEDEIKTRRQKFYRKVTKCLRNGNACYVSPVSESTL